MSIGDAIITQVMHLPSRVVLTWLLVAFVFIGVVASLAVPLVVTLLERTKRKRALARKEISAEFLLELDRWKVRAVTAEDELEAVQSEMVRVVGLLDEKTNHDRLWALRTRREIHGKAGSSVSDLRQETVREDRHQDR